MKPADLRRRALLAAALLATVAAALWDTGSDPIVSGPVSRAQAERSAPPAVRHNSTAAELPELEIEKLDQKVTRDSVVDAFEVRSWAPPPPPPPVNRAKPEPPQAPPLPYTFMGRIVEDGQIIVFLTRQDRNYAVRQGETIDGTYRVDDIKDSSMTLKYLPFDQQQTLAIGTVN